MFLVKPTRNTPHIEFDTEVGSLTITGQSYHPEPFDFYQPLFGLVDAYVAKPKLKTVVNINLEHMNSGTSRCLYEIFKKLSKVTTAGNEVVVNWRFENDDDDMMEAAEDFRDMTGFKFNIIELHA